MKERLLGIATLRKSIDMEIHQRNNLALRSLTQQELDISEMDIVELSVRDNAVDHRPEGTRSKLVPLELPTKLD